MKQHVAAFEAQLMRKLSNTEAELKKKALLLKKACISLVPQMIPHSSRCEFEVAFAWIVKKLVFLGQISWILKLRFED